MKQEERDRESDGSRFQGDSASGSIAHARYSISIYSPYGYCGEKQRRYFLLGFNGALQDDASSLYLLGNGHRGYSGEMMRFVSPDSWSPFLAGGINSYAYCQGDPVNFSDHSGKIPGKRPTFLSLSNMTSRKGNRAEYLPDFLSRRERSLINRKLLFKRGGYRAPETYRERNRYLHGGGLPRENVPVDAPEYLGVWRFSTEVWSLQSTVTSVGYSLVSLGRVRSVPVHGRKVIVPGMRWNEYLHLNRGQGSADFGRGYAVRPNSRSMPSHPAQDPPPDFDLLQAVDALPSYDELSGYVTAWRRWAK